MKEWYPITQDITDQLINLVNRIEAEYPSKKKLLSNRFIKYLQNVCFEIDLTLNNIQENIQSSTLSVNHRSFTMIKKACEKLITTQNIFLAELQSLGSERNSEFEDFHNEVLYELKKDTRNKFENQKQFDELKSFIDSKYQSIELQKIADKSKLPTNPFPTIFQNKIAFDLFETMNNHYSEEKKTELANYSFLYYAMTKDLFIICKGVDFIKFLSINYKIDIDKIDNRQYRNNSKIKLYNALKLTILK